MRPNVILLVIPDDLGAHPGLDGPLAILQFETGVMVVAKSERAYSALKQAFRERTVDKRYHALVQGHPDPLRGTVDAPIGRAPPSGDGRVAGVRDGRPSITHYDTLEAFRGASLVSVHLETGRTHQDRK